MISENISLEDLQNNAEFIEGFELISELDKRSATFFELLDFEKSRI